MISIIVPIYNKEKYLRDCLESIAKQTYVDFECLLIDDGSTDSSKDICKEFCDNDARFKYVYKDNGGVSSARNLGINLCKGDWIGFPDPDDTIEPTMYEKLLDSIEDNVAMVQCGMNVKDENRKIVNFEFKSMTYNRENDNTLKPGYDIGFVNRAIVNKHKLGNVRFPEIDIVEDSVFNVAVLQNCGDIKVISEKLYNYVMYEYSLCHKRNDIDKQYWLRFYKTLYEYVYRYGIFQDNILRENLIRHIVKCISRYPHIDFVLPYVNTTRQSWIDNYNKYCKIKINDKEARQRYQYDDFLKYILRGIDEYMPWISTVHLIVECDEDIPDYVDKNKINIIYHSDYIPLKHLPTFNSCTIETYMSKLLISNTFIYGNDDMFPIGNLQQGDFFIDNKPVDKLVKTTEKFFLKNDVTCKAFLKMMINAANCKKLNGYYKCQHTFGPLIMTNIHELFDKHRHEIDSRTSRFRADNNISQWYYHYDQCFNRGAITKYHKYDYIGANHDLEITKKLLNDTYNKSVCINFIRDDNKDFIINWLNNKFSKKSSFEI